MAFSQQLGASHPNTQKLKDTVKKQLRKRFSFSSQKQKHKERA